MIEQMMQTCNSPELRKKWSLQREALASWQKGKTLGKLQVGTKVDIRDKNYIWCLGTVNLIVESAQREPLLVVRFENASKPFEEVLQRNSPRLALEGTYTGRDDLPCYLFLSAKILNLIPQAPAEVKQAAKKFNTESEKQIFEFVD